MFSTAELRCIRYWTRVYLQAGSFPQSMQGKHPKSQTIILDENVQIILKDHIKLLKPISPEIVLNMLNTEILSTIPNAPRKISLKTTTRWLHFLGYSPTTL